MSKRRDLALLESEFIVTSPRGIHYLLDDRFLEDVAAGALDGTLPKPGPGGPREAVDTTSKMSVSGGELIVAGASGTGDPGLWYASHTRIPGKVLAFKARFVLPLSGALNEDFGFDTNQSGLLGDGVNFAGVGVGVPGQLRLLSGGAAFVVGEFDGDIDYILWLITRATGVLAFIKGGSFAYPTLIGIGKTGSDATLYPGRTSRAAHAVTLRATRALVPDLTWMPPPVVSDGFGGDASVSDGLGHAEGVSGGIGAGGGGVAWIGRTWTNVGGKAINTPTGAEVSTDPGLEGTYTAGKNDSLSQSLTPTLAQSADTHTGAKAQQFLADAINEAISITTPTSENGRWYRMSLWAKRTAGSAGTALSILNHSTSTLQPRRRINSATYVKHVLAFPSQAGGLSVGPFVVFESGSGPFDTVIVDDVSLFKIDPDALFDLVQLSTPNAWVEADITFESSPNTASPTGIVFAADSQLNPQNYAVAFMGQIDSTLDTIRIALWKCVAGTLTQVMAPVTVTYVAGSTLRGFKDGTKYRVYYDELEVGAEQTISDASIINNTLFGKFSTYEGNTLDNFVVRPRGTNNEYGFLNRIAQV